MGFKISFYIHSDYIHENWFTLFKKYIKELPYDFCLTLCLFLFSGGQVAKLYRDSSLGNVVNIIVARLIVLTEDQVRDNFINQNLLSILMSYTVIILLLSSKGSYS